MTQTIHCRALSHMNLVVEDFDASVAHFRDLFSAEFLLDLPAPAWHACLIEIGGVILELFAPHAFLLHTRYGPHHLGVEYEADMDEVRAVIAARNIRVVRDIGPALHTDPADGFGASFEFFGGTFRGPDAPKVMKPLKAAAYWRDEHPLGLIGQKGYTHAVSDLGAASQFLQSFLGAKIIHEAERPALAARAIGLQIADAVVELIAPAGEGSLQRDLQRAGQGIRSTIFQVRDLERARRSFTERGIELVPGTLPDSFAIAPSANRGLLFEFAV